MYGWVTHTWNPIRGKCPHDCSYCYMKRFIVSDLRFDEKEMKTDLGQDNFIFVGSSTDMFAQDVPIEWIRKVLDKCREHRYNKYLFQTKNPKRFMSFGLEFPTYSVFGTTIETNRNYPVSKAPTMRERFNEIWRVYGKKMISIEPIMDFDLFVFSSMLEHLEPDFVSIGADSQRHNLPEPSPDKVRALVERLRKFTDVKLKDNLDRIVKI